MYAREGGDANGDGRVNFSDYLVLSQHFGVHGGISEQEIKTSMAASETIQEEAEVVETAQAMLPCSSPAMAVMIGLGLGCFAISSWRDRE